MQPDDFRAWRKALGWKQKDAADKLGLKKRVIQYYEKGDRDGKAVEIPKTVELACLALALGHDAYDGSPVGKAADEVPASAPAPDAAPADAEAPAATPEPAAVKTKAKAPAAPRKKGKLSPADTAFD